MTDTVSILGINGRIGQFAAKAFIDSGWNVIGFGRENRVQFEGFEFRKGDGFNLGDVRNAIEGADVVVHALNLLYDKWEADAERLNNVVIEAMKGTGKTLVFSANVYNYLASDQKLTANLRQKPETAKGHVRMRMEQALQAAGKAHGFQVIMVRAGDFYGPGSEGSWFDLAIAAEVKKGKIQLACDGNTKHTWAYLPDLGRVFEKVSAARADLNEYENFHFKGHYVTGTEMAAAIQKVSPSPLKVGAIPWWLFSILGLFQPIMREILAMRYLWQNPHQLVDPKLDELLGDSFGTPFDRAIAETTIPMLPEAELNKLRARNGTAAAA